MEGEKIKSGIDCAVSHVDYADSNCCEKSQLHKIVEIIRNVLFLGNNHTKAMGEKFFDDIIGGDDSQENILGRLISLGEEARGGIDLRVIWC